MAEPTVGKGRASQRACQVCWPMQCTNSKHWEPTRVRKEYLVCPDCGSDTLMYEPERSGEDAYLACACGWIEAT